MTTKANHKIITSILIVEDDDFLRKAYEMKLKPLVEKGAIDVWFATDGQSALEYLKKDPPTLVFLDLMLPQVSGFEILETLRKQKAWASVPVIVLSALGQKEDIQKAKSLGATDYIVKQSMKVNDIVDKIKLYL